MAYVLGCRPTARSSVFRVRIGKSPTRHGSRNRRGEIEEGRAVQPLGHSADAYARELALAGASGLLTALSFPKYGSPAFGLDRADAPVRGGGSESRRMRAAFRLGFVTGVIISQGPGTG